MMTSQATDATSSPYGPCTRPPRLNHAVSRGERSCRSTTSSVTYRQTIAGNNSHGVARTSSSIPTATIGQYGRRSRSSRRKTRDDDDDDELFLAVGASGDGWI